jgi:translation initiation factor IF-2
MLAPHIKRTFVGRVKVKTVFKLSKAGIIAGGVVEKGKVIRGAVCQLIRDNETVFSGKIQTLRRFKDDVREVSEGLECGVGIGFDKIAEGDNIDVFSEEVITRRLQ